MSQQKLLEIYELYTTWAGDFEFACEKGCATCCTQSVSMTTLEGELIHNYLQSERPGLLSIIETLPAHPQNQKTTNQFAAQCLREEEEYQDVEAWNMNPCAFLRDSCCSIYPVRSFMCRSFGSRVSCRIQGEAEVEPVFLTLNTVILQCIEHIDRGRPWGNMNMILQMINNTRSGDQGLKKEGHRIAEPIPGFFIPPDEADAIHERLEKLLRIIKRP